jgi:hypothetical protein
VLENFGYRQLVALWRVLALLDLFRKRTWGQMRRRGLGYRPLPETADGHTRPGRTR